MEPDARMNCFRSSIFAIVLGTCFTNARLAFANWNVRFLQIGRLRIIATWHCCRLEFRYSDFEFCYSYLSAVTGSSLEALQAGAKPESSPVRTETSMLARTSPKENWIGNDGKALPIPKHNR